MDIDTRIENMLKGIERLEQSQLKTDEQQKKTDEQQKKTDEQIQELRASQKQTDEQLKKTDEQLKKTDKKLERIGKRLGNMGITQGLVAEEFFFRSLEEDLKLGEVTFDEIEKRVTMRKNETDYDILLKNGDSVGLIEVKYNAHPNQVREVKEKKINQFRSHFQEYKNYKLYFGIASLITSPELVANAKEEGIFLLTQKGNHLEIVNQDVKVY